MISPVTLELDALRKFNIDDMSIDILIKHIVMTETEIDEHITDTIKYGMPCPYIKQEWIDKD